jgi:hypothetical protein
MGSAREVRCVVRGPICCKAENGTGIVKRWKRNMKESGEAYWKGLE